MIFLPQFLHLHGQKFSGVLEKFSCTSSFFFFFFFFFWGGGGGGGVKNAKKTFLKINVF